MSFDQNRPGKSSDGILISQSYSECQAASRLRLLSAFGYIQRFSNGLNSKSSLQDQTKRRSAISRQNCGNLAFDVELLYEAGRQKHREESSMANLLRLCWPP